MAQESAQPFSIQLGEEELVIRRRYEVISIANDFLVAVWFLVGSVLMLFPQYEKGAVWLFILGSVQFLARPAIRLANRIHLRRIPPSSWES